MITKCCICGNAIETKFQLAFEDLLGSEEKIYYQKVGLCKKCGYIFTQNPFTQQQLENRYKNQSKFEYDSKNNLLNNDDYKQRCIRQYHFLMENIDFTQICNIFEVGAASGYNLSLYRNLGLRLFGVEPSFFNCCSAKKNYGVNLFNGMFDDYCQSHNERFDIIFLSMVLEHIVNPFSFILKCNQICDKYIFIEVPTLDLRHCEEPMGIFAEEHVNLFTLDSLNMMMSRAGFRLINVETTYGIYQYLPAGYPAITTVWEKCSDVKVSMKYNIFSSEELLDKYILESRKGLKLLQNKINSIPSNIKLAIWGVGHHASMLLANTNLRDKNIVQVYDSDKRKSGLIFADKKIQQFNRNDIDTQKIDAILLTTYTAQKAILNYLKDQNVSCPIITLYDI